MVETSVRLLLKDSSYAMTDAPTYRMELYYGAMRVSVEAVDEKIGLATVDKVNDQLAKQGVLPGKPGACVAGGIILIEGLVHESGS